MNIFEYTKQNADIITIANVYGIKKKDVCPFHKDQNPSFSLSEKKQIFKCFGCNACGDVIDLVAKLENMSKTNACKHILKLIGANYVSDSNDISAYRSQRLYNQKLDTLYHKLYKDIIKQLRRVKNIGETFNSYTAFKYASELEMILEYLDITLKTDEEELVWIKDKLERTNKKWQKVNLME